MCRNIKMLFNFEPPATDGEIQAAALQFVHNFNKPSKGNEESFQAAVAEIAAVTRRLLVALATNAPPKNRAQEAAKARKRSTRRSENV
jgi:hypothetical protein